MTEETIKNENKEENKKRKIIIKVLIILIIILLLLTSCSVINHFGRIGEMNKEEDIDIHENLNDPIINKNDKLKFEVK